MVNCIDVFLIYRDLKLDLTNKTPEKFIWNAKKLIKVNVVLWRTVIVIWWGKNDFKHDFFWKNL